MNILGIRFFNVGEGRGLLGRFGLVLRFILFILVRLDSSNGLDLGSIRLCLIWL